MGVCALLARTWDDAPAPVDVGDGVGDLGPPAPALGVLWAALTTAAPSLATTLSWRPKRNGKCAGRVIGTPTLQGNRHTAWQTENPYESS